MLGAGIAAGAPLSAVGPVAESNMLGMRPSAPGGMSAALARLFDHVVPLPGAGGVPDPGGVPGIGTNGACGAGAPGEIMDCCKGPKTSCGNAPNTLSYTGFEAGGPLGDADGSNKLFSDGTGGGSSPVPILIPLPPNGPPRPKYAGSDPPPASRLYMLV